MFARVTNGLSLARASWEVLKLDKELLVFPLLSGIACLMVLASFAVPLIGSDYVQTIVDDESIRAEVQSDPLLWVVLFAFYFANYFVIVFFNSALVGCAMIRFQGGDPTVADGFRIAFARLPQIASWALVSATVGVILKAIESRSERIGKFVAGLLGMAWGVTTYFVVPVLVVEKVGPFEAIKRSVSILRRAWGEALVSNIGIGLVVFFATLICFVPGILGAVAGLVYGQMVLMAVGIAVSVVLVILVSLISSALHAVIVGALYQYASNGKVPGAFDSDALRGAFASR
ncbi:MAG TPA: DUF6159 family protein [Phycisphaerae bacterium]|nr:DUF6159 family protein [Phycisphaerae bacterium]HRY66371.1 DUF6159 family protein [Phycisphaerae bacterium]HSA25922.1 DUF6159 family protein [Phycisphaerae bacterium]